MPVTVGGRAARNASTGNGRYSRIVSMPTFSPRRTSSSTVSARQPADDPIATTTRSASGAPW